MRGRFIVLAVCAAVLLLFAAPAAQAAPVLDVTGITPDIAARGSSVECTVSGYFYHPLNQLNFAPEFRLQRGMYVIDGWTHGVNNTGSAAYVSFDIPMGAPLGLYTLHAEQTTGMTPHSDFLADAFLVVDGPHISQIDPPRIVVGSGQTSVVVAGSGFFRTAGPGSRQSTVIVDGHSVPTWFQSEHKLVATIPAHLLVSPRVLWVSVLNPGLWPGDDVYSNVVELPVYAPPVITALTPSSAVSGGPAFTLTVTGANFALGWYGAVVRWNSTDLATTRDSATQLRATVPASLIASAGSATITVRNGGHGAPVSNAVTFPINAPTPLLAGISPTQVWAGYVRNDLVLTANGSNFFSGARIALNGVDKTGTTFVNATQLTVPLAAADIASPGTVNVSVKNPPFPPGSPSAVTLPLTVAAETTVPQVSIGGADSGWHNSPVLLSFAASDSQSGIQKVQYMAPPGVSTWTTGTSYTVPTTSQGAITVSVQALDWCNKVGTAQAVVNIDTTKPATVALDDATVKKGHNARLKFRVEEPAGLSPKAAVTIKIMRGDGSQAKKLYFPSARVNSDRVAGFTCNLKKGTYKWYVYATDLAGNTQQNVAHAKLYVK